MKNVYLLFSGVILASGVASAQNSDLTRFKQTPSFVTDAVPSETVRPGLTFDRAADDTVWINNFDDPADWTAAGPSGDFDINGWSIGTATNSWVGAITADMGTDGNFARFANGDPTDNDPAVVNDGPFTLTYTGSLDLTGIPAPHFEFEQYGARFITLQSVEVSIDGGISWVEIGNNNDITPLTNGGGALYPKPQTRRYNMTAAIAGGEDDVMIRFAWDGAMNGADMNYVDYGWFVDNARVVEGHAFDSDIQAAYVRAGVGTAFEYGLEYYQIPLEQASELSFAAEMINQGGSTFTNLELDVNVDFGGSSVFTGNSNPVDVLSTEGDSLGCTTGYTPEAEGTYTITWSFSGDDADTYPSNDAITDEFEVTDYLYARDNGEITNSITNWAGAAGQPFAIGNGFEIFADGVVGGIEVQLADADDNVGQEIYGQILVFDDGSGDFVLYEQSPNHEITAAENGNVVQLILEDHVEVSEGDLILVVVGHYGGTDVAFGMAQSVDAGVWGYDASSERVGLADPEAIMVRAHMRSYVGINEVESGTFSIGQNQPNPFGDNAVINYELKETANVAVEFVDMAGKTVYAINHGMQAAGSYSLDVDAAQFAEGVYFYTFTVGTEQITKKMVVTK